MVLFVFSGPLHCGSYSCLFLATLLVVLIAIFCSAPVFLGPGIEIIYNLDEVDFIQNLVFYIEAAYRTPVRHVARLCLLVESLGGGGGGGGRRRRGEFYINEMIFCFVACALICGYFCIETDMALFSDPGGHALS